MALTRIDTGEQATPLSEIEKRTDAYKDMTDNQLLREALAKSSVNCNGLIKNQNTLVKGLTDEVKSLKENDSISNGDGGRVSGSSEGGTSVQDGNKSNYKKRDYSFSK